MSGSITEVNHNTGSIFNTDAFRGIIAKEFSLQTCLVDINLGYQGDFILPSFIKKKALQKDHLIIGAVFDKTGEHANQVNTHFPILVDKLITHPQVEKFGTIELRTKHKLAGHQDHSDKVELGINLNEGLEHLWDNFSRNTRRSIRQPLKKGFTYRCGAAPEMVETFYQLYLKSMHSIGSLVHSKQFFIDLCQQCNHNIMIFVGYLDDKPVISSFNFICQEEVYGAWSGFDPDYKKENVFIAMLWSISEYSHTQGIKHYNLGRSSINSTQYTFKKKVANFEQKIYYYKLKPIGKKHNTGVLSIASKVIKKSPNWVMKILSRLFIQRFY